MSIYIVSENGNTMYVCMGTTHVAWLGICGTGECSGLIRVLVVLYAALLSMEKRARGCPVASCVLVCTDR